MAKFVKGNWVEVCHYPDYKWEHWTGKHTDMCKKTAEIVDVNKGDWVDETYIEVEYRGKRIWFKDDHLIRVEKYEKIFKESVHEACEQLQRHEKLCKKLRDDILRRVFGEEEDEREVKKKEPETMTDDDFFGDWEEVTTKEIIPLPGNGGTMTNPDDDPKSSANSHRKKIRKIKGLGTKKKITKKSSSKKLTDSWTLSDDEIKELEGYLDALPYSNPPSQTGDYDYKYDTGDDDDTEWFT